MLDLSAFQQCFNRIKSHGSLYQMQPISPAAIRLGLRTLYTSQQVSLQGATCLYSDKNWSQPYRWIPFSQG